MRARFYPLNTPFAFDFHLALALSSSSAWSIWYSRVKVIERMADFVVDGEGGADKDVVVGVGGEEAKEEDSKPSAAGAAEEGEESGGDAVEEEEESYPLEVDYCSVCGLPFEYCEYGPTPEECLAKNGVERVTLEEGEGETSAEGKQKKKKKSKKVKISVDPMVKIARISRSRKKYITVVGGLGDFPDVKMKDAAKKLGKQFACGASVNKTASGAEEITIQGDVLYDLPAVLEKVFKVSPDKIIVIDN